MAKYINTESILTEEVQLDQKSTPTEQKPAPESIAIPLPTGGIGQGKNPTGGFSYIQCTLKGPTGQTRQICVPMKFRNILASVPMNKGETLIAAVEIPVRGENAQERRDAILEHHGFSASFDPLRSGNTDPNAGKAR